MPSATGTEGATFEYVDNNELELHAVAILGKLFTLRMSIEVGSMQHSVAAFSNLVVRPAFRARLATPSATDLSMLHLMATRKS